MYNPSYWCNASDPEAPSAPLPSWRDGRQDPYDHEHPSQSPWPQTPFTVQKPEFSALNFWLPNRGYEASSGHKHPSESRWPQTPFTIQSRKFGGLTCFCRWIFLRPRVCFLSSVCSFFHQRKVLLLKRCLPHLRTNSRVSAFLRYWTFYMRSKTHLTE